MRRSGPIFTTFECNYSHYEMTEKTWKNWGKFFSGPGLNSGFLIRDDEKKLILILFYTLLGYIEYPSHVAYPIKWDIQNRDRYPINSGTRLFRATKKTRPDQTRTSGTRTPLTINIFWKLQFILRVNITKICQTTTRNMSQFDFYKEVRSWISTLLFQCKLSWRVSASSL